MMFSKEMTLKLVNEHRCNFCESLLLLLVNFCFLKLFSSLARNENSKRPGFYTLQLARLFSNFPHLKQLNKIKNTC